MELLRDCDSYWLWPSCFEHIPNQYVQFRHEFTLPVWSDNAQICISCDSNYALWINDEFLDSGQYHDFPDGKTCDILHTHNLTPGKNVLALLVHYQGEGSYQYIKGSPGLFYQLESGDVTVSSGKDTLYRIDSNYKSGPIARITAQLGYTFDYDARGSDDWRLLNYTPGTDWASSSGDDITPIENRPIRAVRPIKKVVFGERIAPRVAAQGVFVRKLDETATVAELVQTDFLSSKSYSELADNLEGGAVRFNYEASHDVDGMYLVLDLGREEAGYLDLDIDASAGTIVDVAWGEHLDDLRVHAYIEDGANFASRYVCKDGRQNFTHYFARLGARYLQLHISNLTNDLILHYVGLIPVEYPVEVRGSFTCSDSLHNRIYETSVRTLQLCMHEHYEDCPWREQSLYAMDMRNQALAGYYCFGEYDFPAASLDLLSQSLKSDGFLEMCAPAEISVTIPVFSLAWILAVADHYQYSGNIDVARRLYPVAKRILDKRAETLNDGLITSPHGERYWHFYDWADGLNGLAKSGNGFDVLNDVRCDAPLNLFYLCALDAAAKLADALGDDASSTKYRVIADDMRHHVHEAFWFPSDGSYRTFTGAKAVVHYAELTQALAILAGVCDEDVAESLRKRLATVDNSLVRTTLSYSLYKFEALLTAPALYGQCVFDRILNDWGHMLTSGATSFWETINGASENGGVGSLCHGWSGIPAYFYHAYILGVKPTTPGFVTFEQSPLLQIVESASGIVPTPHGRIEV